MDEDTTAGSGPPVPPLTWAQRILAGIGGVFFAGLAGLGGYGSYASVQDVAEPWFGGQAWIVPAGVDLGILALVSVALLLEWLAMPMPALRWMAMAFTGATVWLNVSAAHGDPAGVVMHAAMPVLFVTFVEAVRHAIRRRAGIAAGTVREGVPLARWLLAPVSTFRMWRRMVLWQITSYPRALTAEQRRRRALALLRDHYGRAWKSKAPADVVWMLSDGVMLDQALARVTELTTSAPPVGTSSSEAPPVESSPVGTGLVGAALDEAPSEVAAAVFVGEPPVLTKAQASDSLAGAPVDAPPVASGRSADGRAPRPATARPAAQVQLDNPAGSGEAGSRAASVQVGDPASSAGAGSPTTSVPAGAPGASVPVGAPAMSVHAGSSATFVQAGGLASSAGAGSPTTLAQAGGPAASAQASGPASSARVTSPATSVRGGVSTSSVQAGGPTAAHAGSPATAQAVDSVAGAQVGNTAGSVDAGGPAESVQSRRSVASAPSRNVAAAAHGRESAAAGSSLDSAGVAQGRNSVAAGKVRESSAPRRDLTTATAGTEARAQIILAADPNITGAELGRRLNLSARQGQRLLNRLSRPAPSSAAS
ncbi:DUF2637 domain-containing protein [Actinomadura terrae]|uniref:DUF2637 domain-containing protein n=1 Tax=Actinomadura terrae TaxID=604353 RepID=UPI001FA6E3AF|nr:DUF2637 domain-containing protein [Actinomadura terrae]